MNVITRDHGAHLARLKAAMAGGVRMEPQAVPTGEPGRFILVTGMAMPGPGTVLAELAAGGRSVRHAGPADGPVAPIRELFRSPGAEVTDGPLRVPRVPPALAAQATTRLREIFPAASITGEPDPFRLDAGLSSALPAVAACLTARPGGTLLLEYPEACLHPHSQAAIGRLACQAAASGAHVGVMTHSEHVLNAARLAVAQGWLPADDVAIRHHRPGPAGTVITDCPALGLDGMLTAWPPGFFDQADRDLGQLLDAPLRQAGLGGPRASEGEAEREDEGPVL